MQVLGGHAHEQGGLVDQLLGDEARVRVHALAHGVAAHVLDTAGEGDVVGTEGHTARDGGHGGQRAGAHAVDGVARYGLREARENAGGTAQRQALVTDLRGRGDGDLVDLLGVQVRVAAQQLPDRLHDEVVGAGLVVDALRARLAERGADAVDEDDVPDGTRHVGSPPGAGVHCCARGRSAYVAERPLTRPCYLRVTNVHTPSRRSGEGHTRAAPPQPCAPTDRTRPANPFRSRAPGPRP